MQWCLSLSDHQMALGRGVKLSDKVILNSDCCMLVSAFPQAIFPNIRVVSWSSPGPSNPPDKFSLLILTPLESSYKPCEALIIVCQSRSNIQCHQPFKYSALDSLSECISYSNIKFALAHPNTSNF